MLILCLGMAEGKSYILIGGGGSTTSLGYLEFNMSALGFYNSSQIDTLLSYYINNTLLSAQLANYWIGTKINSAIQGNRTEIENEIQGNISTISGSMIGTMYAQNQSNASTNQCYYKTYPNGTMGIQTISFADDDSAYATISSLSAYELITSVNTKLASYWNDSISTRNNDTLKTYIELNYDNITDINNKLSNYVNNTKLTTIGNWSNDKVNYNNVTQDLIIDQQMESSLYNSAYRWESDFVACPSLTSGACGAFYTTLISSGTLSEATSSTKVGVIDISDSTTINGGARIGTGVSTVLLKKNITGVGVFIARAATNPNVSIYLGFQDSVTSAMPVDGCYFNITNLVMFAACSQNSARTYSSNSYTLTAATWYGWKIDINTSGNGVYFNLSDADVGTLLWNASIVGNIPYAGGRETGFAVTATQSSITAAATLIGLDYMGFSYNTLFTRYLP
jgi:hypothetical protein